MHMITHRLLGQAKLGGNLFVGHTAANEKNQLLLAAGKAKVHLHVKARQLFTLARYVAKQGRAQPRRADRFAVRH